MKKYSNQNIRKLTKTGSGSYYCIIPKEIIRTLRLREKQKLFVRRRGQKIIISVPRGPQNK